MSRKLTGQLLDFNQAKRQGHDVKHTVDADDIRSRLHADPCAFVEWMFSGRAFMGKGKSEARVGDVYGTPGASLSIHLTGPDAGLWKDHATDEGGDLIALYRAFRGYRDNANFVLSLKEIAKDFLGDPVEVERTTWQATPLEYIEKKKSELGTKPRADLIELGAPVATYTYYDTRGNVTASVVRYEPDGTRESKTFRPYCFRTEGGVTKWVAGAPDLRPLYRLPDIALASEVVLCEGEGCADALTSMGIPATSAMQGANTLIDKTDWSPLAGKTVTVWPDNDQPGFQYAKNVSERLAAMGCTVKGVTPPSNVPAKWDAADCVAEGGDAHAIIANATQIASQPKARIKLVTISQLAALPPPSWLIDGIITESGLSMMWGRSGSLKSFVALDQSLCVATGTDWHGRKVEKGRVVYLAAEGAHGLGSRAIGWLRTRGRDLPEPDFQIIPHGLTLVNPSDLEALIAALTTGNKINLIIIDTLSRTFGGGNPNQPSDMNAFVSACDRLREATGSHVMVVHHGGKDTDKNELGNEGLRNASDTVIHVRRRQNGIELINEAPKGKQKDYEEFKTIHLAPVKVSYEQNGTEQQTLVLNLDEQTIVSGSDEPLDDTKQRLGSVERKIIASLTEAGSPLGATRLALMTKTAKGTLYSSLESLAHKKKIEKIRSKNDAHDEWRLI